MTRFKLVVSALLAVVLLCTTGFPISFAVAESENLGEQVVTFSDFNKLDENECIEKNVIDSNGNTAIVGIERIAGYKSFYSADSTWRVWFNGVTINAEFYMTVSDNKVKSVYDESISVIGGTYEDDELTMDLTYGKLSFKVTSVGGIMSGKCWLKGTITGSENKIDVTWRM